MKMKNFNLLKIALITSGLVTSLSACGTTKYVEGEQVHGKCIYNGYETTISFYDSFDFEDEKLGKIHVNGKGDCYEIGGFKAYDSLYLADVNGDGYNDLCTDYVYTNRNKEKIHTYAFYNYKKKEYIVMNYPEEPYSTYLYANNGILCIKEFSYQHDISNLYMDKYLRRRGYFLTNKTEPTIVWNKLPLEITALSYTFSLNNETGSSTGWRDEKDGSRIFLATTGKTYSLIVIYNYNGYLDEESDLNLLKFEKDDYYYKIQYDSTFSGYSKMTPYVIYVRYYVELFVETKFTISLKYQDVNMPLKVYVDNSEQYPL